MNRREFIWTVSAAAASDATARPLIVPIRRVMNIRAKCTAEQLRHFWWRVWPEAARDFSRGGMQLQCSDVKGEIKMSAGDRPIFMGLERGVINLVLTDHLPLYWDKARSLAGMTTTYEGCHLCVIAINYAHGHQFPFVSVNTCVHELLHLLLQDVYFKPSKWFQANERETRDDAYATRLWLFRDGGAVRKSAEAYLNRLRTTAPKL